MGPNTGYTEEELAAIEEAKATREEAMEAVSSAMPEEKKRLHKKAGRIYYLLPDHIRQPAMMGFCVSIVVMIEEEMKNASTTPS